MATKFDLEDLNTETYAIEHNPNCPSRFLIRLIPRHRGRLDHLPASETQDILIYGVTLEDAVHAAVVDLVARRSRTLCAPRNNAARRTRTIN